MQFTIFWVSATVGVPAQGLSEHSIPFEDVETEAVLLPPHRLCISRRALFAGVDAKQLAGSGEWIVGSASRPGIAYRTDGVTCDCEAAMLGGDPVCLHRAAYWYAQGMLELDPEPGTPAPAAPVICFRCRGTEAGCPVCQGAGVATLSAQAAALRVAA